MMPTLNLFWVKDLFTIKSMRVSWTGERSNLIPVVERFLTQTAPKNFWDIFSDSVFMAPLSHLGEENVQYNLTFHYDSFTSSNLRWYKNTSSILFFVSLILILQYIKVLNDCFKRGGLWPHSIFLFTL